MVAQILRQAFAAIEAFLDLEVERGDPGWVAAEHLPTRLDEGGDVIPGQVHPDLDARARGADSGRADLLQVSDTAHDVFSEARAARTQLGASASGLCSGFDEPESHPVALADRLVLGAVFFAELVAGG